METEKGCQKPTLQQKTTGPNCRTELRFDPIESRVMQKEIHIEITYQHIPHIWTPVVVL